jgi:hypothetical protein
MCGDRGVFENLRTINCQFSEGPEKNAGVSDKSKKLEGTKNLPKTLSEGAAGYPAAPSESPAICYLKTVEGFRR